MTKTLLITLLALGLLAHPALAQEDALTPKQTADYSYSLGIQIGSNLNGLPFKIDVDKLTEGLKDLLSGADLKMTDEEIADAQFDFQEMMFKERLKSMSPEERKQMEPRMQLMRSQHEKSKKNSADGKAYLAANAKKEGVVTTDSGLQYKVVAKGSGATPTTADRVLAHYTGTLLDGTKFDSSHDRGKPSEFGVTGVIKGWTEALLLMKEGDKWQLTIPSELAYGDRGNPPTIEPASTLIFDIELVEVVKSGADSAPAPHDHSDPNHVH